MKKILRPLALILAVVLMVSSASDFFGTTKDIMGNEIVTIEDVTQETEKESETETEAEQETETNTETEMETETETETETDTETESATDIKADEEIELPVFDVPVNDIPLDNAIAQKGDASFDDNFAALEATGKKIFYIKSYQDWINLAKISSESSLEGYEFVINKNLSGGDIDTSLYDLSQLNATTEFPGIGTDTYPFKGKLRCSSTNDISLICNRPLFVCLGGGAIVQNILMQCTGGVAGLAKKLTGSGTVELMNIFIHGSLSGSSSVGGLFAEIVNESEEQLTFTIIKETGASQNGIALGVTGTDTAGTSTNLTIAGVNCGSIAGRVIGNVIFEYDDSLISIRNTTIKGSSYTGSSGFIFGKLEGTETYRPVFKLAKDSVIRPVINSYGSAGGVIGTVDNGVIDTAGYMLTVESSHKDSSGNWGTGSYDIYSNLNNSEGGVGGVFGVLKNSSVTDDSAIYVQNMYMYTNNPSYAVGGVFGYVCDSDLGKTSEDGKGYVVRNIKAIYGKRTGGVIGYYRTTAGTDISNTISHCKVYNSYLYSTYGSTGEIIGYCLLEGNGNMSIDGDFEVAGCYMYSNSNANSHPTGNGIIGRIESKADSDAVFKIENGTYQRSKKDNYRSIYVGSYRIESNYSEVAGVVGSAYDVNIEISNIAINSIELYSYNYCACVIGKIDNPNGYKYAYIKDIKISNDMILSLNGQVGIGFIAGYVGRKVALALDGEINLKGDGTYPFRCTNRTSTYYGQIAAVNMGSLIFFDEGASDSFTPYSNASTSYLMYVDEVGNYGGVFRNGKWDGDTEDALFTAKSANPINGTVTMDGAAYNINTVGDMLRLAVVFNTEGNYGLEAFGNETYANLLRATYYLNSSNYNMTDTGLVAMQRNRGTGTNFNNEAAYFTGKFLGKASEESTIIHKVKLFRQPNFGYFIYIGSANSEDLVEFSGIKMNADYNQACGILPVAHMGGLATFAVGNVTVDNCDTNTAMLTGYNGSDNKGYLGGLFGRYTCGNNTTLSVNEVNVSGEKHIYDKDNFTSQLIGYVVGKSGSTVNISGISIQGKIIFERGGEQVECLGGLIAVVNNGGRNMYYQYVPGTNATDNIILNISDITYDGFELSSKTPSYMCSGILGFSWTDVNANISNVYVNNNTKLKTYSYFGGFLTEATGKIAMENIIINSFSLEAGNYKDNSGLLIGYGQYLYLSIKNYDIDTDNTIISKVNNNFDEIVGKNIIRPQEEGGIVSISSSDSNKNLVAGNGYKSYVNQASYTGTAGVSAQTINNSATRYYYDIPEILKKAGDDNGKVVLSDKIISSPEELMDWHLINYSTGYIKKYFVIDENKTAGALIQDYEISGEIDLNGYSYYPTNISGRKFKGINYAKIIFYAQEINDGENGKRATYNSARQHYLLHSGLFYNIAASEVSNLILAGTVSKHNNGSGGLCTGGIFGVAAGSDDIAMGYKYSTTDKTIFNNIILDNLWVAGTANMDGYYGLMIYSINAGAKVEFNKIKMDNYDPTQNKTSCNKAAAALIGLVGSKDDVAADNVIEINVSFTNMDIADLEDDVTLPDTDSAPDLMYSSEADKVLAHASFIYQYQYYEDTCWGLYTFYQADYLKGKGISGDVEPDATINIAESEGYITMGYEIGETVEFYDNALITPIIKFPDNSTPDNIYGFKYSNYKPYVYNYSQREIFVNPKPGDITEGCGTYEDPYVIENVRQMTSLYYYLKNNIGVIQNWKVNKIGDDTKLCDKTHTNADIQNISDPASDFPTRSEMNQAYYLIKNDIKLSEFEEFSGFGSATEPFVGVFVGNITDGKNPVIYLPNQSVNNTELDSFAFIKYAKGCVVKDIDIRLGSITVQNRQNAVNRLYAFLRSILANDKEGVDTGTETEDYIKVKSAGAGVIAYVLGGDNIIDNVSVEGKLKLANGFADVNVGGYVGQLRLGTLIIRNIPNNGLNKFAFDYAGNDVTKSLWIGGIIGNVRDGIAVYEGYSENDFAVFDDSTNIGNIYTNEAALPATPNYSIINAEYINQSGLISVTMDSGLKLKVSSDGQLMMLAAAISNGALTYEGKDEVTAGHALGYNTESRCRNGNYDRVGNVASDSEIEYADVIKNDNLNGAVLDNETDFFAPYVFNYIDAPGLSIIRTALFTDENGVKYNSNYINMIENLFTVELGMGDNPVTYNMAVYKKAFRGLGSLYNRTYNYFKGNIDGKGSTINMDYAAYNALPATYIGLLNYVKIDKQTDYCYIKDLTLSGAVVNTDKAEHTFDDMSDISGKSVSGINAGGLIGMLELGNISRAGFTENYKYNYYFDNVDILNLNVGSLENSGGLIAQVKGNDTALGFNECEIRNLKIKSLADAAGLLASSQDKIDLRIEQCQVKDSEIEALGIYVRDLYNRVTYSYPSTAGFVGRLIADNQKSIIIEGGSINNITLHSTGHSGGLIGQTEAQVVINSDGTNSTSVNDIKMLGLGVIKEQQIGEVYLKLNGSGSGNSTSNVELTKVNGSTVDYRCRYLGSFGGCVGFAGAAMTAKNITVTNPDIEIPVGVSTNSLIGGNSLASNAYNPQTFVGGLAGIMYNGGNIDNCTIGSNTGKIRLIGDAQYTRKDEFGNDTYSTDRAKTQANLSNQNYNRVGVGGFIGSVGNGSYSSLVSFSDCQLIGGTTDNSRISGVYTGGYIAINRNTYNGSGSWFTYTNCSVDNVEIGGVIKAAGIVGYAPCSLSQQLNNVNVRNSIINTYDVFTNDSSICSAGFFADVSTFSKLYNCSVTGCTIGGVNSYYSGGFGARLSSSYGQINCINSTVSNNTIMGSCTGGIAGYIYRNYNTGLIDDTDISNNRIIAFYNYDNMYYFCGGAFGYGENSNSILYGYDITIQNNLIAAVHLNVTYHQKSRVGGFCGYYRDGMKIDNITLKNNIIGMLDNTKFPTGEEYSSLLKKDEYIKTDSKYNIWTAGEVDTGKITDAIGVFENYSNVTAICSYPDEIQEEDLYKYASNVGVFAGIINNSNNAASITRINVIYTDGLEKYRPAVDVGYNASSSKPSSNSNIYTYWSKYHIVYPRNFPGFDDLEEILADYKDTSVGNFATINYRLQYNFSSAGNTDFNSFVTVLENTYKDNNGYLSPYYDVNSDPIKMVVYDNTDLDKIINSYINIITNNGGAISNNGSQNGMLKVSAYKMRVTNGVAVKSAGEKPSINVSNINAGQNSVTLTVNNLGYDTFIDERNGTYTVLRIEYGWDSVNNTYTNFQYGPNTEDLYKTVKMTPYAIEIPIFVKKILEIDTHIIGINGSQYDIDKILTEGSSEMSILRGIYTAYIEYNYNDAVSDYNERLEKELYFLTKDGTSYVPVFENTKLTLIDLNTSKVYYYKAPSNNTGSVKLSAFKDVDGNEYTEPVLNTLDLLSGNDKKGTLYYKHYDKEVASSGIPYDDNEEVAMQKYLLLMDTSEVSVSRENSYAYTVNLKPITNGTANTFLKKCRYPINPECTLKITEILGIKGSFTSETKIIGEVDENTTRGLIATIDYEITASQSFWDYKNSSSDMLNEYIDIAFYLIKNGIRTPLPVGSMVTFNKGTPNELITSTTGETILYFYKDSGREHSTETLTQDEIFSGTIDFDFRHADFSDFEEGTYTVRLELLKTNEKEFPMGGDSLDIYESEFQTRTERNLGFVVAAKELMSLGMNAYLPEPSDLGDVEYTAGIDFTDYIPKSEYSNKDDFREMAQKYFTIKYELMRKIKNVDGSYSYIPYTGDDVKLYYNDEEIPRGFGVTFRLSERTLISGNRGKNDHVYEIPFELKANVDNLITSKVNITNYKVVGHLYVSDSALDGSTVLENDSDIVIIDIDENIQPSISLNDYYIFTVAKLKKDLNIG